MEDILQEINQHYHNKGVSPTDRYVQLKQIFQQYATDGNFEKVKADATVLDRLKRLDLHSQDVLQAFFMKFGETFLHKSLDQFYTPWTISEFLGSLFAPCSAVLEPASGTGDLILNVVAQKHQCWDISKDAVELASLNFTLHRVSGGEFQVKDTLLKKGSPSVPLILTNPPFGVKTVETRSDVLSQYTFSLGKKKQQLGLLFLEQCLNLLLPGGIVGIILPTGYLTNKTEQPIRKMLLENYRIVALFLLPDGTFKRSGTGVDTSILIIQKTKIPLNQDYRIFTEDIRSVGIQTNKKGTPPLYQKNPQTGAVLTDEKGQPLLENSLPSLAQRFLTFVAEEKLPGFAKATVADSSYSSVSRNELLANDSTMNLKLYLREFCDIQRKVRSQPHFTISGVLAPAPKSKKRITKTEPYVYLDISEIGRGSYNRSSVLRGWELPNRAKHALEENDILVSKLKGTPSFCMIFESKPDTERMIATNGVVLLRIADESKRLMVFRYLFTDDFAKQFNAYTGGSIMANIKEEDLFEKILFPQLAQEELESMRSFVHHLREAHKSFQKIQATQ